jgi:hypothetical protein
MLRRKGWLHLGPNGAGALTNNLGLEFRLLPAPMRKSRSLQDQNQTFLL